MKVAHLKRSFLGLTEQFVYTQLIHLKQTEAVILTHEHECLDTFPDVKVYAFCDQNRDHLWADLHYRILRRMSQAERDFFRQKIGVLGPDLFHAHYAHDAAYFLGIKQEFDKPLVVSCYGHDVSDVPNRFFSLGKLYLRPVWRCADVVLAMSDSMRQDLLLLGCEAGKIQIHYHGVNLSRFKRVDRSLQPKTIRILFVGALEEIKGVEYLIRAFSRVACGHPETELRLVGTGRLEARLKRLARSLGLGERVQFPGFVPHEQLQSEFSAAHIFCHPSTTVRGRIVEGIPGTIVEAMSTGLPVVTTQHAGIPEMVVHSVHGFVVPEKNESSLAQSLRRLIDKPDLRLEMGNQGAQQARDKGDGERQTVRLESIYREAIRSRN